MNTIKAWRIVIFWEDGEEERYTTVPKHVAEPIDEWLGEVEQERNDHGTK